VFVCALVALAAPLRAADAPTVAAAATGDLKVAVVDQTGAALIIATVTLVDATGAAKTVKVDDHGIATFAGIATGDYMLKAEAESFQSYEGKFTVKKGANQVSLKLPLAGLNEQVVVRNTIEDVRGNSFTTELSQQEIAELPEDPDELQQVLEQMAGPGATMRVNGFTGGRLPPKSQIRSIRFRQNSFDAEYHEGGGFGIDIVTKPGMTGWKGMSSFGFRDDSLNARNAFAPTNQPMQYRRFGLNADGPVVKGKTSIAFDLARAFSTSCLNGAEARSDESARSCSARSILWRSKPANAARFASPMRAASSCCSMTSRRRSVSPLPTSGRPRTRPATSSRRHAPRSTRSGSAKGPPTRRSVSAAAGRS